MKNEWCREMKRIGNTIFVSEYNMPDDFKCFINLRLDEEFSSDFDYMEKYIRAMEKVVIADVVKYKDKELAVLSDIVNNS